MTCVPQESTDQLPHPESGANEPNGATNSDSVCTPYEDSIIESNPPTSSTQTQSTDKGPSEKVAPAKYNLRNRENMRKREKRGSDSMEPPVDHLSPKCILYDTVTPRGSQLSVITFSQRPPIEGAERAWAGRTAPKNKTASSTPLLASSVDGPTDTLESSSMDTEERV